MEIEAIAHGTGVIVDAIDKGASFAIDLEVKAMARLLEDEKGIKARDKTAKDIAKGVLKFFGYEYGLEIETESEIPPDNGFGEKEATAVATALSVLGVLARKHGVINELRIDKYLRGQFLIIDEKIVDKKCIIDLCMDSGVQFDRASASLYGGFIIANNKKREILRRGEMESLHAVILIPKGLEGVNANRSSFKNELELTWNEALRGNLYTAMRLNSLLYGNKNAKKMLDAGALTVSRSREGGVIALSRDEDKIRDIVNSVKREGRILIQRVMNTEAKILVKPKKVIKIREFLELKRDQEFNWL